MARLLIVSQVYPPDSAAVGQYLADFAEFCVAAGREVTVLTSSRGYENPAKRYPRRELRAGVDVRRLPGSSFGKASLAHRLIGGMSLISQAIMQGLKVPDVDHILISTSPPLAALAAMAIGSARGVPWSSWVMDVNPDQAVAMGHFGSAHPVVYAFDALNRVALRQARHVIALDEFMATRLAAKVARPIEVIPPWPLDDRVRSIAHETNDFRRDRGWSDKVVVMFSGNMSPTSPVDTAVDAAYAMQERDDVHFVFIGGGQGRRSLRDRLRRRPLPNVELLEYQPLDMLCYSLSAADLHVVTMGEAMVGITHPCKVYTAMAVERPLIAIAPERSHVGELMTRGGGWRVDHGDVRGFVAAVDEFIKLNGEKRAALGAQNRALLDDGLSASTLRLRLAALLEGS